MIDLFKRLFGNTAADGPAAASSDEEHEVMVAVCALFLEMGRIDATFTRQEMEKVLAILKTKYGVTDEEVDALIAEADRELDSSVDMWQFARVINERFSNPEKEALR